jgi:CBS domain-containing protein
MRVSEVMMRGAEVVAPGATLQEAAEKMRALDVGLLPVCDGDTLVGMLTDRDITVRATAAGESPREVTVQEVMTIDVVFCLEDDSVEEAAQLMEEYQVHRLPVLDRDHRLLGIVSHGYLTGRSRDDAIARSALEPAAEPGEVAR